MAILITPDDPRFNVLKRARNGRWPSNPADAVSRVALCLSPQDTADALQQVISAGQRPTIRSGGHCYEDFYANNPKGTLIDMSMMNQVGSGTEAGYRVGAGATLGQAYQELYKLFDVTLPGGTCGSVGAGGHITGGGYGLVSRLYGTTADWVSGVEILAVDSQGKVALRTCTAKQDPDLLRACRGAGGGNFGVIVNYLFDRLPAAPQEVVSSNMIFPWSEMTEEKFAKIFSSFGGYFATRGQDPETWGLFSILEANHQARGFLRIETQFCNPDGTCKDTKVLDEFLALFDALKPSGSAPMTAVPSAESFGPHRMTRDLWADTGAAGGMRRGTTRAKYKSTYMKKNYTEREIGIFYKHLTQVMPGIDLTHSVVEIDSYGGAMNRKEMLEETSAFQRSSIMKLQFQTYWGKAGEDDGHLAWIRDFYQELYSGPDVDASHQGTPFPGDYYQGCYINYPDADMLNYAYWPQLYYGPNYEFLQQVKKKYDPNNVFHHAMSVRV
ncbi:MAG: FAD-binding oxidoreductase [Acidobacteriaceae bacterium]